jgi:hypothetical protein
MILEVMADEFGYGNHRKEFETILEKTKFLKTMYTSLERKCEELKSIVSMYMNDLHTNPNARPKISTKNVGVQAVLIPEKVN